MIEVKSKYISGREMYSSLDDKELFFPSLELRSNHRSQSPKERDDFLIIFIEFRVQIIGERRFSFSIDIDRLEVCVVAAGYVDENRPE